MLDWRLTVTIKTKKAHDIAGFCMCFDDIGFSNRVEHRPSLRL